MIPSAGLSVSEMLWLGIGLLGQMLFSMRFIIQWLASEKQRKSVIFSRHPNGIAVIRSRHASHDHDEPSHGRVLYRKEHRLTEVISVVSAPTQKSHQDVTR